MDGITQQGPEGITLGLVPTDIEIKLDNSALPIPLNQLPAYGATLSSFAAAIQSLAPGSGTVLFKVTDALGNAIDPSMLQKFSDGTGLLGSFRDPINGFGQARLHVAGTTAAAVIDPTLLLATAAIAQITQKLDAIQQTQEEIFNYLKERDKAELRGSLQTLTDIARDYRFNWQNEMFLKNAHMKTLDIREKADSASTHLRAQIKREIGRKDVVEIRPKISTRLSQIVDLLSEYRISIYLYSFASFLEPMLSGNLQEEYLKSIAERISARSIAYRELYTDSYNVVEDRTESSADTKILEGASRVGKALGNAIANTPLGDRTPIDEALIGVSDKLGEFNDDLTDSLASRLLAVKSPGVLPFQQGVSALETIYNKPLAVAADSQNIYLFPAAA